MKRYSIIINFLLPLLCLNLFWMGSLLEKREYFYPSSLVVYLIFYIHALYLIFLYSGYAKNVKRIVGVNVGIYILLNIFLILSEMIYTSLKIQVNIDLILYYLANYSVLNSDSSIIFKTMSELFYIRVLFSFFLYFILLTYVYRFLKTVDLQKKGPVYLLYIQFFILLLFYLLYLPRTPAREVKHREYASDSNVSIPFEISKKYNILLFLLEGVSEKSFRESKGNLFVDWVRAEHFFIPIPHSTSSIYSLLTGRISEWKTKPEYKKYYRQYNFIKLYKQDGYNTRFIFSGKKRFENLDKMLSYFEIAVYDEAYIRKQLSKEYKTFTWGIEDKALLDCSEHFYKRTKEPFLHILYFTNTHSPYFNPEPDRFYRRDNSKDKDRYLNIIEYDIKLIQEIIRLTESYYPQKTIYLILSDHGESFGEQGFYKHGFSLFNSEIKVPFYLKYPENKTHTNFHSGTILDVFPTLLSIQKKTIYFQQEGRSLYDKNYSLKLKLHSWGSKDYSGIIENSKKIIYHDLSGKKWETDLDETEIIESP
ncbi:MAG: sulfatase-like hydrolase/transferase [Leptospiraceae bacterium]|nr:sulfatase-like hydrolase/transferase [Leptospiraceae bacterium]